jgi:hypothetical protein
MRSKRVMTKRSICRGGLIVCSAAAALCVLTLQLPSPVQGENLPESSLIPYFVSWHVTAHGSHLLQTSHPGDNGVTTETVSETYVADSTGSAVTRFRQYAGATQLMFNDTHYLTFTERESWDEWRTVSGPGGLCISHLSHTIADPGTYAGFRAAVDGQPWDALLQNPPEFTNGAYVMRQPLKALTSTNFGHLPIVDHMKVENFGYQGVGGCTGESSHDGHRNAVGGFSEGDDPRLDLRSTPKDPTSFFFHTRYSRVRDGSDIEVDVDWTARAYPMGKCAQRDGPIAESDPVVADVNVHIDTDDAEITPDGKTKVRIRVTCEGVPVEGANVKIEVEPVDSSGAHIHVNDRPKGKLDGKDLTSANPSITRTTDKNGTVKGPAGIIFSPPGKAPASRCLGLAGSYKVTATSEKFKDRMDRTVILVRFKNLTMLPKAENYDICADSVHGCNKDGPWGTSDHPESEYGTAGTIQAFQAVGTEFWNVEQSHNQYLHACNAKPWPMRKVSFNDIALPWGGLFDMDSTWTYPHRTHGKGQGGDFNHFHETCDAGPCLSCGGASVNLNTYLWSVLKSTGEQHGRWDSEVNSTGELHLHVEDQGQGPPASCPADN